MDAAVQSDARQPALDAPGFCPQKQETADSAAAVVSVDDESVDPRFRRAREGACGSDVDPPDDPSRDLGDEEPVGLRRDDGIEATLEFAVLDRITELAAEARDGREVLEPHVPHGGARRAGLLDRRILQGGRAGGCRQSGRAVSSRPT